MPNSDSRRLSPARVWLALAVVLLALAPSLAAQVPSGRTCQQLPVLEQAQDMLRNQPALVEQLRQRIGAIRPDARSGARRDSGRRAIPRGMLDDYLQGADTTKPAHFGPRTLDAVRALGVVSAEEADSLARGDSLLAVSDSLRELLDSIRLATGRFDPRRFAGRFTQGDDRGTGSRSSVSRPSDERPPGIRPSRSGPVDENYRLGPGDQLVLILTGDVERAYTLEVTREGFIVIPQVGQVYAANLTLQQLEDQLYARLGKVYSGVRRSPNARTKFQISIARLRNIQVYVAGDVVRPGAYQISSGRDGAHRTVCRRWTHRATAASVC